MARTIKSKKCKMLNLSLITLAFLVGAGSTLAASTPLPKLPVIQQVGVIPVQWEGGDNAVVANKAGIEVAFPEAVRGARRFRVLNDDLISSLWGTADGREELRSQFELQGFVSLTVTPRSDTISLTARLMDSYLKSNLLETEIVTGDWLANAPESAVKERMERLVFRLFNRIPVDVSVTSVQGAYITLSGGAEQGVEAGDRVDLVRAEIKSLHPANGTWLDFQKQNLGTAQVIEVKTYTSVAKLTGQTYDNAVQVGDGARVAAIASRVKFARLAENDNFKDAGNQDTIVVPPLYNGAAPPKPEAPVKPPINAPTQPNAPQGAPTMQPANDQPAPAATSTPDQPAPQPQKTAQANKPTADAPPADNGPTLWDDVSKDVTSHSMIDDMNFYAGPHWWTVKGPTNSAGKFPIWLLNSIGGGITHTLLYKIKTAFGGGLMFGKTGQSSYYGYDSYARMYWEEEMIVADGFIKGWHAGGIATFSGMSVPAGDYGGGDFVRGGGYGGFFGTTHVGENSDRYDWTADYSIMPLTIGRIGYGGTRKVVESAFGWKFSLSALQYQPARIIQWGGGLDVSDERQTLKNGRRPHFQEYSLKVLAKYVL